MKNFIILLLLIATTTATTIQLSNTSSDYQLCIYTGAGEFVGCATNENSVYISRNDYIMMLSLKEKNLFSISAVFGIYSTFIFVILILLLIIFIGWSFGAFTKLIK